MNNRKQKKLMNFWNKLFKEYLRIMINCVTKTLIIHLKHQCLKVMIQREVYQIKRIQIYNNK